MGIFKRSQNTVDPAFDPSTPPILEVLDVLGLMPAQGKVEPTLAPENAIGGSKTRKRPRGAPPLRQDAQLLREKNDLLAAALGACPECWGGVPDCVACQGQGRPGFFAPDTACFAHFVLPAVKRAQSGDLGDVLSDMPKRNG